MIIRPLDNAQAARYLKISLKKLWEWKRESKVVYYIVEGKTLYDIEDLRKAKKRQERKKYRDKKYRAKCREKPPVPSIPLSPNYI